MANKEELRIRIDELIEEEAALDPLEAELKNEQAALEKERGNVLFDATVVGDEDSKQQLVEIDQGLEEMLVKFEAIVIRRDQLLAARAEVRTDLASKEVAAGLRLGGKFEEKMAVLVSSAESHIAAAGRDIVKLRELSTEAQNRLTAAGLSDAQMLQFRWRILRNEFSSKANLVFGSVAKLNLNRKGNTPDNVRWWEENNSDN